MREEKRTQLNGRNHEISNKKQIKTERRELKLLTPFILKFSQNTVFSGKNDSLHLSQKCKIQTLLREIYPSLYFTYSPLYDKQSLLR
jgi:hypothetical protein